MKRLLALLGPLLEEGATIMVLLFLSLATLIFFIYATLAVSHPYPLDYGEAPLVDQAMRLADGQNIYRPALSSPPYTISNYPPLYVLTLVPTVWLFGPTFWAGRVISLLCALASATFLALIIYTYTQDRIAAGLTGMLFLAIPYVVHWSSLLRVDLLALALSLAGLYVLIRWPAARLSTIVGALLLVAAIYTRQSYALAAPLAALIWLCAHNWRQAIVLAALVGGLTLALFLVLNVITRGGFYFNIVTANVNEFGMERLEWNLRRLRDTLPYLLFMGAISLVFAPTVRVRLWPLLVSYLVGASLSTLTIGKIGSNGNYFLEVSAALSLAAGVLVAWGRGRPWLRAIFLVLLALQTRLLMRTALNEYAEPLQERRQFLPALHALEELVANADGPVLADEYMGMITLQRRPLYVQPFEVTQLANAGLWDQTPLLESIRNRKFPIILIHYFPEYPVYKERWTVEMLSAINRAYIPTDSLAETRVYRPIGSRAPAEACPGAPWRLPTNGLLGVRQSDIGLDFFGWGNEGSVPVYAVADGLLTRLPGWSDAVAVQHDDPLRPGEKVWSYYGHMASADGSESYIVRDFPLGSTDVPVAAGQPLGYQGRWSEQTRTIATTWTHLRFSIVRAAEDGLFPREMVPENVLDPSPYLGITLRAEKGYASLRCEEQGP
jgi:hypothetical protein